MSSPGKIFVVLPGITGGRWQSGGLLIARKVAELMAEHRDCRVVTSVDREPGYTYLDDLLAGGHDRDDLFVITWGPHVGGLIRKLGPRRIAYFAQSTGWDIRLPRSVPIVCLSRYIMASWMYQAPHNPLFLLGPVIEDGCRDYGVERDIDVLFIERKSTSYLRETLVPALRDRCHVHTLSRFVPRSELFALYNRSRVYLYSSAPWSSGWVEGFGFQPLEALLCGCTVFSNLHGGLSDYLDPELIGFKLETYALEYDLERITEAVRGGLAPRRCDLESLRDRYSEQAFHLRAGSILSALDRFFLIAEGDPARQTLIRPNPEVPRWRLWFHRQRKNMRRRLIPGGRRH